MATQVIGPAGRDACIGWYDQLKRYLTLFFSRQFGAT
jgi:hypothetical protein